MITKEAERHPAYLKYFLFLAALFSICTYLHDLIKALLTSDFGDFAHYYAFTKLMHSGYDVWTETPALMEKISGIIRANGISTIPTNLYQSVGFLFMVSPFTLLPYKAAAVSWVLVCQAAFAVSIFLIFRMAKNAGAGRVLAGLFLVFSFWPLREDMYVGQPNLLVVFFITLALVCFKKDRFFLGGVCVGLAIQVKEIYFLLLALLLLKKQYRAFAGAACAILLPKAAYVAMFGMPNEFSYWVKLVHSHAWINLAVADQYCLSIFSVLAKAAAGHALGAVQVIVAGINAFLLAAAWRILRPHGALPRPDITLEFSYGVVFCLVVSPWVHETHLAVVSIAVLACWLYLSEHGGPAHFLLFCISYLLLGLKYSVINLPFYKPGLQSLPAAGKTIGLVLFFYLLNRVMYEKNRTAH